MGLAIGGWLFGAKANDQYGNKVKKFGGGTRANGFVIMVISAIMFAIATQMGG